MKKNIILLGVIVVISLSKVAQADPIITDICWKRQANGIKGMITCFINNAPDQDFAEYLTDIAAAETNLLAYGISPEDSRLVSPLFKEDMRVKELAYCLLIAELQKKTGWTPSKAAIYQRKTFGVYVKGLANSQFTVSP